MHGSSRLLRVLMSRWEAEEKASHVREKMRWGDKRRRGLGGLGINIELPSVSCVQPDPYNQVVDGCVCVFVCMYVCVGVRVNEWKCWNPIGVAQIPCRLPGDWLQLVCRHPAPRVCDMSAQTHTWYHTLCWLHHISIQAMFIFLLPFSYCMFSL